MEGPEVRPAHAGEIDAIAAPGVGPTAYPPVGCISVNDAVVHAIPGHRPFEPGDLVSIDIACSLDGWAAMRPSRS